MVLAAFLAVSTAGAISPVLAADAPVQIWFVPLTHNIKPSGRGLEYVQHDLPALLQPNAPWQTAASRLSGVQMQSNVVTTYPDIPGLLAFLHSHKWKVALGFSVMFDGGQCKQRLEGISADTDVNREAVRIAQKWKQAGGSLDQIVLDSPLWFGHFAEKTCAHSIADVAQRTSTTLKGILANFPNARIVDAEGPGWIADGPWQADMTTFFAGIRASTGHPVDGVLLDLHWHDLRPGNSWQATTRSAVSYFHRSGVSVGLIINAPGGPNVTEPAWIEENRQHLREAAQARLGLDFITIDQWQNKVRVNLPETDPNAYTSLIDDAWKDFGGR